MTTLQHHQKIYRTGLEANNRFFFFFFFFFPFCSFNLPSFFFSIIIFLFPFPLHKNKMSLTFESPTHRGQSNEAYFTPLNMPSIRPTSEEGSTPYYTAPINPAIHQDFLNAIQLRHAGQPTVLSSPVRETKLGASLAGGVGVGGPGGNNGGFTLNMDSLANRRRAKQLQQLQQPQPGNVAAAAVNNNNNNNNSNNSLPIEASQLHDILKKSSTLVLDVRSFVQFSHSHISDSINISIPNTILKRPTFTLDKVYEGIVLDSARERLKNWQAAESIVFYDQASLILQENSAGAYLGAKLIQAGFKGQLYHLKGR
jgi:protein-tyrosine phosphatase